MNFSDWLNENNLSDLIKSTIDAFPHTTRRQYATDTIKITKLIWTPYLGLKTLFVSALSQNEGREYSPVILFKDVRYGEGVSLAANDGKTYKLKPLSFKENDVLLRCQCGDFHWRFKHYDHVDHSLYGRNRKKYEGQGLWEANPKEIPGMCKHLLKVVKTLESAGIIT